MFAKSLSYSLCDLEQYFDIFPEESLKAGFRQPGIEQLPVESEAVEMTE